MTDNNQFFGEGWRQGIPACILPGEKVPTVMITRPIFDHDIEINCFTRQIESGLDMSLPPVFDETVYEIKFCVSGSASNAFLQEFYRLVDKYNEFEVKVPEVYAEEVKKSAWRKFVDWVRGNNEN